MKICKKCKQSYDVDIVGSTKKYCSKLCRDKTKIDKINNITKWKIPKTCLICKKGFIPKNERQKLCSSICSTTHNSFEYKAEHGGLGGWEKLRFEVFKRDNFTCQYCGRNVKEDKIKLACDHVIPKSKGGQNVLENLITACFQCNNGKKDILL